MRDNHVAPPILAISAAAYYRMSTDRQEDSIDRQRSQVEPYAAQRHYQIVRVYKDEGIAGDEVKKRTGFVQMLSDAQKGLFQVILCDDKDRFGRFDSIDQGFYIKPLRDASVHMETVAQGKLDWYSFAGRVTDAVLQEAKKIESQATSRRVITRMLMMAKEGKWLGGKPPYAYAVGADPILGKKLVPGDPLKVKALRLMFELYGDRGYTLDMLARELFERGILNPKGGKTWNKSTIRNILRCRKYVGDLTWNAGHDGKYSEVLDGAVRTNDQRTSKRTTNKVSDWIIVPNTHEPLIDRPLFERVQAKLGENKAKTTPLPKGGDFVLTGLLVCGHCGWRMIGSTHQGKRFYKCGRYHQEGRHACAGGFIMEKKLIDCLTRKLQEVVLNPKNQKKLREEVRRLEEQDAREGPPKTKAMKTRFDELGVKINWALDNAPGLGNLKADFMARMEVWKKEREQLGADLERIVNPPIPVNVDDALKGVEAHMRNLKEAFAKAEPSEVREVIRELVTKIELWFGTAKKKGLTRRPFRRGLIYIRPQSDEELTSNLYSAASPIPADSNVKSPSARAIAPVRG
jgi:site-specific DNA recombinase